MRKIILFFSVILFLIVAQKVNAISCDIKLDKKIFYPGDIISINSTIINDEKTEREIFVFYTFLEKPEEFYTMLRQIPIKLDVGEKRELNLFWLKVTNTTPAGSYLFACIISNLSGILPTEDSIIETCSVRFNITGTLKRMSARIRFCKSEACEEESKTFLTNESIYLKIETEKEADIEIDSELPFVKNGEFFVAKNPSPGDYSMEILIKKKGYQDLSIFEKILVIEDYPKFEEINLTKEYEEKIKVEEGVVVKKRPKKKWPYLILAIFILLVIVFVLYKKIVKKRI